MIAREALITDARKLLCKMVETPSVTFSEEAVSDCICKALMFWGIRHERIGNNIICYQNSFDPAKKTLLLCAHMDTVPAADGYSFDPHTPENPDMPGAIFGLGSNDDGGSVAAMLSTLRHYAGTVLPFNLIAAITAQEEKSGPDGVRSLKAKFKELNVEWCIVGEPTGMQAATSEKGLLVIDATAKGISGHAARNEGVNALYIAIDDINALRNHTFAKKSGIMEDVHLNVTQINAGTAHNVIPDTCTFVVDIRPSEAYDNRELLDELQGLCSSTLTARNLNNRSSATRVGSPLIRCLDRMGIKTFSSSTTSDWMHLECDAIKMGPGESSRSHKKDEYLLDEELYEAIDTYIEFIRNYADTLE